MELHNLSRRGLPEKKRSLFLIEIRNLFVGTHIYFHILKMQLYSFKDIVYDIYIHTIQKFYRYFI